MRTEDVITMPARGTTEGDVCAVAGAAKSAATTNQPEGSVVSTAAGFAKRGFIADTMGHATCADKQEAWRRAGRSLNRRLGVALSSAWRIRRQTCVTITLRPTVFTARCPPQPPDPWID